METSVFDRTETDGELISPMQYNLAIGATLLWGFALNWWIVANVPTTVIAGINPWVLIIGYVASCWGGIYLFQTSDKPLVSFIGYNLVVIPFGFVLNLVISQYDPALVVEAVRVTALVTVGMMCLGTMFPAFFQKIAGALTGALIIVVIVEMVEVFIFKVHHGIIDWIVAAIFCGYIGYDWGRANQIPKTLDNAIDSAAALYMDIINLFLRILRILSRR